MFRDEDNLINNAFSVIIRVSLIPRPLPVHLCCMVNNSACNFDDLGVAWVQG